MAECTPSETPLQRYSLEKTNTPPLIPRRAVALGVDTLRSRMRFMRGRPRRCRRVAYPSALRARFAGARRYGGTGLPPIRTSATPVPLFHRYCTGSVPVKPAVRKFPSTVLASATANWRSTARAPGGGARRRELAPPPVHRQLAVALAVDRALELKAVSSTSKRSDRTQWAISALPTDNWWAYYHVRGTGS